MALGSGDHHNKGSSSLNQGKIPCEYAENKRAGLRSPPNANRPLGSSNAVSTGGKGAPSSM